MSDTARMLDDTAERLLARRLSDPLARRAADLPALLRADAIEAGLPLALVPEAGGGLGGTLAEASVIAWRCGWHAAPLAVVPMLLLPTLPGQDDWVEGTATLAEIPGLRLDKGQLSGPAISVPAPEGVRRMVVLADSAEGPQLVELELSGSQAFAALDHARWLSLDPKSATIIRTLPCPIASEALRCQGALLTAAAMAGAMARVLDIVIEHANTRKQFGRPLGKFQVIQHMLAEAASEYTVAQAALQGAVTSVDTGSARPIHWQSAKAQAARAAGLVASVAHQVLGAIGFTEEHVLHHYSKRLWVWRDDWGRQAGLEAAIGTAAASDPRGLWSHLVDAA